MNASGQKLVYGLGGTRLNHQWRLIYSYFAISLSTDFSSTLLFIEVTQIFNLPCSWLNLRNRELLHITQIYRIGFLNSSGSVNYRIWLHINAWDKLIP